MADSQKPEENDPAAPTEQLPEPTPTPEPAAAPQSAQPVYTAPVYTAPAPRKRAAPPRKWLTFSLLLVAALLVGGIAGAAIGSAVATNETLEGVRQSTGVHGAPGNGKVAPDTGNRAVPGHGAGENG